MRRAIGWLIWAMALSLASPLAAQEPAAPTVRIESGAIAGTVKGDARMFLGVPFAAPPVSALRWKPPAPAPGWRGVRPATASGPACLQKVYGPGAPNLGGYAGPVSEDCLTLDVVAPLHARRAPVMVWIFGGGNSAGGTDLPSYDARAFARDGIVWVAMNYRLGVLGFFAHPALTREAPASQPLASYGLMDQIAALRWVRRNIAAFGGDPDNVTVFGESAGGVDILDLMAIPGARGLFARAIVESGGGWAPPETLAVSEKQGAAVASRLGLAGADASAAALRALPADKLLADPGQTGGVAVDGRLMKMTATQAFARGKEAPIPLIIGTNSNEASLMRFVGLAPETLAKVASPTLRAAYATDGPADAEIGRQMFNDHFMGAPARWIAAREARKAPAWLYYFSYVPPWQRSFRVGVNHASEVPFVFDSLDWVPDRAGRLTPGERAVAAFVHSCWVAFARNGVPACAGGPAWPRYGEDTDTLLDFAETPALRQHFRKTQLDAQQNAQAALLAAGR